jgi:hypothetical protein
MEKSTLGSNCTYIQFNGKHILHSGNYFSCLLLRKISPKMITFLGKKVTKIRFPSGLQGKILEKYNCERSSVIFTLSPNHLFNYNAPLRLAFISRSRFGHCVTLLELGDAISTRVTLISITLITLYPLGWRYIQLRDAIFTRVTLYSLAWRYIHSRDAISARVRLFQ